MDWKSKGKGQGLNKIIHTPGTVSNFMSSKEFPCPVIMFLWLPPSWKSNIVKEAFNSCDVQSGIFLFLEPELTRFEQAGGSEGTP